MPIDVIEEPETGDQGIGRFIGEATRNQGQGHGSGYDFAVVEFNIQSIIDPATGAPYVNYPTGGMDVTALVADTRHCRFQRILHMQVTPWDSDDAWTGHVPAISVPAGQFMIHRPATGDVLLKLFVQSAVAQEPLEELANEGAIPNMAVRVMVTGVRGLNAIDLSPPA